MAAEVVTGSPAKPLPATPIAVSPQLAKVWDGAFWHRFHKVVS
jgi:xylulokinase